MSLTASERFIAKDDKEYQKGEVFVEGDYDAEYVNALKRSGMIGDGKGPVAAKAVTPAETKPAQTEAVVVKPVQSSQPEDVGTVSDVLPDPVKDRKTSDGTGEYHVPVGSVSGGELASSEPEASVVGTVTTVTEAAVATATVTAPDPEMSVVGTVSEASAEVVAPAVVEAAPVATEAAPAVNKFASKAAKAAAAAKAANAPEAK